MDYRLSAHKAFWEEQTLSRPLASCRLGSGFISKQFRAADRFLGELKRVTPDLLDVDLFMDDYDRMYRESEMVGQDGFWVGTPFPGIPWVEAMLGCQVSDATDSFITQPWARSVEDLRRIRFDLSNPWVTKYLEFVTKLQRLSQGRFPVGQPILRGLSDTLGAIMGQTELVYALVDYPDIIGPLFFQVADFYRQLIRLQYDRIQPFCGGYSMGFYNVWCPGECIWFQEDLSSLLSPAIYRQLLVQPDRRICAGYPYTAVHVHPVSFFILDELMQMKELKAIQINKDTGGPSIRQMIPQLRKIVPAKKLIVWGQLDEADIDCIMEALPGQAIFLHIVAFNLDRAKQIMDHLRAKPS
jgi:hypothetical protein